jgi:5-formyltetrahydrofolate cyclo-ligase
LTPELRREKSAAIQEQLFRLPEVQQAELVLFFVGFGSEVDTLPMIEEALRQGKLVAAPKVVRGNPNLALRQVEQPESQLQPGTMGILEPDDTCQEIALEQIQLILVPAVAWEESGYRLGYGGGFYDRLLARSKAPKVGLGFDCQVVAAVPRDAHDLPVDKLITESRLLEF